MGIPSIAFYLLKGYHFSMLGTDFKTKLSSLYGDKQGALLFQKIKLLLKDFKAYRNSNPPALWDEKDIALITYADAFSEKKKGSLQVLQTFLKQYIQDRFSIVHILPFAPYSSDRGFSIIDHKKVKKEFGSWKDISNIAAQYRLMIDLVSNHVSVQHRWFQALLRGSDKYEDYFIWYPPNALPSEEAIKNVRRGRAAPLLNPFTTSKGVRYLWSTYSVGNIIDQIDLNYHNPIVLLEMVKILLFYLSMNVSILRFDGIGGLWKELGTNCKHLPQNHLIASVFRDILNGVRSNTLMFTETTTASITENSSYLSEEEAHAVYNFSLAPLVLFSLYTGSTTKLSAFAQNMKVQKGNTYFNILDIHDGINMYSVSSELEPQELEVIYNNAKQKGAVFSYRKLPNGDTSIKEMHMTWWSALNEGSNQPFEIQLRKFLTTRAVALSLKGVPGIYYLSLFGTKNDVDAYTKSNHGRDMNRTKISYPEIVTQLSKPQSKEAKIFNGLMALLEKRKSLTAFHPDAEQEIVTLDSRLFSLVRGAGKDKVLALHNLSADTVNVTYLRRTYALEPYSYIWQEL